MYFIAVAQLMGYVSAFAKDGERPPLAIVVTQTRVECLLFPFGERLLKASAFILNLWKENRYSIDLKVFHILGSLINEDVRRNRNVSVQSCKNWEKMRVIVQITSDKAGEVAVMAQQLNKGYRFHKHNDLPTHFRFSVHIMFVCTQ